MKVTLPAQDVFIQTPQGIDAIWYERLSQIAGFVTGNAIGNGLLATTAITGFVYLPTCAGAPTGVPVAKAGFVASVYDTTNHKLWVYDTSTNTWRGVVLT
jgi:hypothetical protein